jgi:pimeloyl-ACP methyl ester carboxylesterase
MFSIPFIDFGGNGPLLHFAHANAYPPACYRQFIEPLVADHHVAAIKHRPLWPGSHPDELTSWQVITDDLIRFFEQEGLHDVIGIGHSLGAVASMYAAVQRPELFRALVLIEPVFLPPQVVKMVTAYPEQATQQPFVLRTLNRRNQWQSKEEAFNHFRKKDVFAQWPDSTLWDYINFGTHEEDDHITLTYPREWEGAIYANLPTAVWERIPQVTQPTLAIRATESDTLFPDSWQLWQELQPTATFVEMADVGHMVPMERPLQVTAVIQNWLEERGLEIRD